MKSVDLKKMISALEKSFALSEEVANFHNKKLSTGSFEKAFKDFIHEFQDKAFALVGSLALNKYISRERSTVDIDFLFESDESISEEELASEKFIRIKPHHLKHKETGVKIDLITPEFLRGKITRSEATQIISNASNRIAQSEDIMKLKLISDRSKDIGDVVQLLRDNPDLVVKLDEYATPGTKKHILKELKTKLLDED